MLILNILIAAAAGFAVGAAWYNFFAKQWLEDTGIPVDGNGNPMGGSSPKLYGLGFLCILVVTVMMAHTFSYGVIETWHGGLIAGLGIGAFFIAPWITLNVLYSMRPIRLAVIDGGYATVACGVVGLVLMLF